MVEISDYVFDRHTKAGRQQGRGWEHWLRESSHIDNRRDDPSLDERQGPFWARYLETKENQRGRWWLRGLKRTKPADSATKPGDTLFD